MLRKLMQFRKISYKFYGVGKYSELISSDAFKYGMYEKEIKSLSSRIDVPVGHENGFILDGSFYSERQGLI